jgi:hypothetical protein
MKQIFKVIISVCLILAFSISAILCEDYYRRFIRFLYSFLSDEYLVFRGKYFFFTSVLFVISNLIFWSFIVIASYKRTLKENILYWPMTIIIFILYTFICCYIDVKLLMAECTACRDKRIIHPNELSYNLIFTFSSLFSLLPIIFLRVKKLNIQL